VALVEGEPAVLNLTVSANPADVDYEWFVMKEEENVEKKVSNEKGRVRANGGVVFFDEVTKEDAGIYSVVAENAEGRTEAKVDVVIHFAARYIEG